jgi:DeoR family transcriptional regulator of aga operon
VIVVDSSKFDRRAFATMGGADLFPMIITDDGITDEQRAAFAEQGYEVVIAP